MDLLSLDEILHYIEKIIDGLGVIVICCGLIYALYQFYLFLNHQHVALYQIRLKFGESLLLGLEFMVGADIIGSLISRNYYTIGLLGLIVLIRSILSFFLNRELQELTVEQREHMRNHL